MLFFKWFFRSFSDWARLVLLTVLFLDLLMVLAVEMQAGTPYYTGTPSGTTLSHMTANAEWKARDGHTSVALDENIPFGKNGIC